jgi:dipeptidyl aminopeptidase/acylaminoacyl peptidase
MTYRFAAAAFLLASSVPGMAADPPPIANFARWADFQNVAISPNGQLLATTRMLNGRKTLQILRLKDRQPIGTFQLAGDRDIEDVYWPNDERVLFGASYRIGSLGSATLTHELMQVNVDGSSPETLIKPVTGNLAKWEFNVRHFDIVDLLRDDEDNVLISVFDDNDSLSYNNLYRINIRTGVRHKIMQSRMKWGEFVSDPMQGIVRIQDGATNDGDSVLLARKSESDSWQEIARGALAEGMTSFEGFTADPNLIYTSDGTDDAADILYTLDLTNKSRKEVFRSKEYAIAGLLRGRDPRNPIGVHWNGARNEWKFFDDKHADAVLFQSLRKALGDVDVSFSSFSKDRALAVAAVFSDTMPTNFFVVDLSKPGLVARLPTRPWIDSAQMSPMQPIRYKARDGTEIQGYLTLPRARGTSPLPMVVLPHGGPFGIRDHWAYDPDVQLLASRGYAVLQPNFRGSGGYGAKFRKAGHGQWGKVMQDDVTDATRWAIKQGYADADRICIYGGSYGAYVALESVASEAGLYRCAIGYAGAYDLRSLRDDSRDPTARDYWRKVMGTDQADLDAHSPALHAQSIKVPVLLVHGEDDHRCPFEQFEKMRDALKANDKVFEVLVKDNEGHGFYDEKNIEEFYTRMIAFLDKHTAPRAKAN